MQDFIEIAKMTITFIHQVFPLGGINRLDVYKRIGDVEWEKQIALINSLRQQDRPDADINFISSLLSGSDLRGACCTEMVFVAKGYLAMFPLPFSTEIVSLPCHKMLVIGRNADSDPNNIMTWGNAIICDPWAKKYYPAARFYNEQQKGERIPFLKPVPRKPGSEFETESDYLKGTPCVEMEANVSAMAASPKVCASAAGSFFSEDKSPPAEKDHAAQAQAPKTMP